MSELTTTQFNKINNKAEAIQYPAEKSMFVMMEQMDDEDFYENGDDGVLTVNLPLDIIKQIDGRIALIDDISGVTVDRERLAVNAIISAYNGLGEEQ